MEVHGNQREERCEEMAAFKLGVSEQGRLLNGPDTLREKSHRDRNQLEGSNGVLALVKAASLLHKHNFCLITTDHKSSKNHRPLLAALSIFLLGHWLCILTRGSQIASAYT